MPLIQKLSNKIGYKIVSILNMDKDHEEVIAYGAFAVLQTLWSIFWVVVLGMIFNVLVEALIISFTISYLRKYSGGVHASSPNRCVVIGTTVAIVVALIIDNVFRYLNLNIVIFFGIICVVISYYIVFRLAPVDSPAKRIKKPETKQRLKRKSIATLNILCILMFALLVIYSKYNLKIFLNSVGCIYIGAIWQAFTLTAMGHNILTTIDDSLKNILQRRNNNGKQIS